MKIALKNLTRIATFTLALLISAVAFGQDKTRIDIHPILVNNPNPVSVSMQEKEPNSIKLSVSFVYSEFEINPAVAVENLQGISVDADAKIFSKEAGAGTIRLGGVFNYQRAGVSQNIPVDTYMAGAQVSYRVGPVEPFAGFLVGVRTTYNSDNVLARKFRVGVDVPFHRNSNFFLRPFFYEQERTEGFLSPPTKKYGAGAGVRF